MSNIVLFAAEFAEAHASQPCLRKICMQLEDVPNGEQIFVDANILIYHFSRDIVRMSDVPPTVRIQAGRGIYRRPYLT